MQTTTNYGLKKPEQNEYISIDDLNFNADKIDEELKKKADESGGDVSETKTSVTEPADSTKYPAIPATGGALRTMLGYLTRWVKSLKDDKVDISGGDIANTKVSAIATSTASFPTLTVNDTVKTIVGKINKWFSDCTAKFGNYVLKSMITNQQVNSTNNIPTSALVYAMQQAITQLNSDKAPAVHNHDDRYYTETEVEAKLGGKLTAESRVKNIYINSVHSGICLNVDSNEYTIPRMPSGYCIYRMELVDSLNKLRLYIYYNGQQYTKDIALA